MPNPLIFQPPRIPLVDKNGLITREWYRYFQISYERIGGTDASTPDEIESDTAQADSDDAGVEELKAGVFSGFDAAALNNQVQELREQVFELTKAIQALQQGYA